MIFILNEQKKKRCMTDDAGLLCAASVPLLFALGHVASHSTHMTTHVADAAAHAMLFSAGILVLRSPSLAYISVLPPLCIFLIFQVYQHCRDPVPETFEAM